jgi:hypothetical protein
MSAPTTDRQPGNSQVGSSGGHRRRRQLLLVASALIVLAVALGTSLAIATRPIDRQAAADAGPAPAAAAGEQNANAGDQAAQPDQGAPAVPGTEPESGSDPTPAGTDGAAPVLEDGEHPAYITKVRSDRIVVDVVQAFHDDDAVKAAIADGTSPSDAKYLTTWVRNQNPRLRTLPLAGALDIKLRDACGDPGNDREALLTKLAANAKLKGTYYYLLTVDDGKVERIEERLAVNAC